MYRSILLPHLLLVASMSVAPLSAGGPTGAKSAPGVVELFTSQGCRQCPPADDLMRDLAHQEAAIVLSFPVKTWDYIGWKDTLAESAFSERQDAYAQVRGDRALFTPQAVINGTRVEAGGAREAILEDLRATSQSRAKVDLTLDERDGHLFIHVGEASGLPPASVYVLRVAPTQTVAIGRGDNSGRRVTYTNVVRAMNRVGEWRGQRQDFQLLELESESEGYVVLLQTGTPERPGPILAAAKTREVE